MKNLNFLVKQLFNLSQQFIRLVIGKFDQSFGTGIGCSDAVIVVCGCQTACAKYDGIESKQLFVAGEESSLLSLKDRIYTLP